MSERIPCHNWPECGNDVDIDGSPICDACARRQAGRAVLDQLPPLLSFDEWLALTPEEHEARHKQTRAVLERMLREVSS